MAVGLSKMLSIVFLVVLLQIANQLEVGNEICLFGRVDAAVTVKNDLLLFVGTNFYLYELVEFDIEPNDLLEDLPERIDNEVYEVFLKRLRKAFGTEKDSRLQFKYKCSVSEICSLPFEHIESAVYFGSVLYLVGRYRVLKLFALNTTSCESLKAVGCVEESYKEFVKRNDLVYEFDQMVDIANDERLTFKGETFYLTANESNEFEKWKVWKQNSEKLTTRGPFAMQTLAKNRPRSMDGAVRIKDELWLFDRDQVYTMSLKLLEDRLQPLRQYKGEETLEFFCEHKMRQGRLRANLNIYEILLLKMNLSDSTQNGGFKVISIFSALDCPSSGPICVIQQTDLLDYLRLHPALYLTLHLAALLLLAIWLASLIVLARLLKPKKNRKFNLFLIQEFTRNECTQSEFTERQITCEGAQDWNLESDQVTRL